MKPGRPQSTGRKESTRPKQPFIHRQETFFACGSSAPVRVEREGDTADWLSGTLMGPRVQGHGLPLPVVHPLGFASEAALEDLDLPL